MFITILAWILISLLSLFSLFIVYINLYLKEELWSEIYKRLNLKEGGMTNE